MTPIGSSSTSHLLLNSRESEDHSPSTATHQTDALFIALQKRGLIDASGRLDPKFSGFQLPPLTPDEFQPIQDELKQTFRLELSGEEKREISIGDLFPAVICREVYLRSTCLIGSYVTYLLFSKTGYAQRVFESLGIGDLYEPPPPRDRPADIDIRMHVEGDVPFDRSHLQWIRDRIIASIAHSFPGVTFKQIKQEVFNSLATIDTGINCFQLLSFKGSQIDWVIYHRLTRHSVFTLDNLFIPLSVDHLPNPQSHRGPPLESFLHALLGMIYAEDFNSIDESGWLRWISRIVKGGWSGQEGLEEHLYQRMHAVWIKGDSTGIGQLKWEINKWIPKHFPNDSSAFLFNLCSQLCGRIKPAQIEAIWNHKIPFPLYSATLHLCACILEAQGSNKVKRRGPALHLETEHGVVRLENSLEETLSIIGQSEPNDELIQLFFKFCPSSKGVPSHPATASLLEHPSPFVKYIGFLFSEQRMVVLERHLFTFRHFPIDELEPCFESPEKWIEGLFDQGKEVAFEVLKESETGIPFKLKLIERLTHSQPHFALRLFMQVREAPKCFETILRCARTFHQLTTKTEEHKRLIETMGRALPTLLDHPDFTPPSQRKFLAQGLLWYVNFLEDEALLSAVLKRHYCQRKERNRGLALQLDFKMKALCKQPTKVSLRRTSELLKEVMSRRAISRSKESEILMTLIEVSNQLRVEMIDWEVLFEHLPDLLPEQRSRAAELLLTALEKNQVSQCEQPLFILQSAMQTKEMRSRLVNQCKVKNLSFEGLESIWIETLEAWKSECEIDRMAELIKETEKRGYCNPRVMHFLKLHVAQSWAEAAHTIEKSYAYAKEISPDSFDDITEYLNLLDDLISTPHLSFKKRLSLIDKIDPCFQHLLVDRILIFALTMHGQGKDEELANWLLHIAFFDTLDDRKNFQTLLAYVVEGLLETPTRPHIKLLHNLTSRYFQDFRHISPNFWPGFFLHLSSMFSHLIYPLFCRIETLELNDPVIEFQLFFNTVETLAKRKDRKLLFLLPRYERYQSVCPDEFLLLACCRAFIEGIGHFGESFFSELPPFYYDAKAIVNSKIKKTAQGMCLWGAIELTYVDLHFKQGRSEEGQQLLYRLLSKFHLPEYWVHAGPLINTLTAHVGPLHYDELLAKSELVKIPGLDFGPILTLLLTYPTTSREIRAARLWRQAMATTFWKPNRESWRFFLQISEALAICPAKLAHKEARLLLGLANQHFNAYKKCLGDEFFSQSTSVILLNWVNGRNDSDASSFISYVATTVKGLPNTYHLPEGERILKALPNAIVAVAHHNEKAFVSIGSHFWNLLTIQRKKQKRAKDRVVLPREKCLEIKKLFVNALACSKSFPSPTRELVQALSVQYLGLLDEDFHATETGRTT